MTGREPPAPARRLLELFEHGVAAVEAGAAVRANLVVESGRLRVCEHDFALADGVWLLAIGKAAPGMLEAAAERLGAAARAGLVVTHTERVAPPPAHTTFMRAGHPVPDARSAAAGRAALAFAAAVPRDGLLLVLLSGGGSALTTTPADGLSLEDLAQTTRALLASGVDIQALNTVRKHTSAIAGGRLAAARGAGPIAVLCLSDVLGDPIDVIASGPCAFDPTGPADALRILRAIDHGAGGPPVPPAVLRHCETAAGAQAANPERDPRRGGRGVPHRVIARNADARRAVLDRARSLGLAAVDLGEVLRGEAREVGRRLAALASGLDVTRPTVWVAGGETTVTVRGRGRGGRSQELALAFLLEAGRQAESGDAPDTWLLAAGTDGIDGPTDAAGAWVGPDTYAAAHGQAPDARAALDDNDAYAFFSRSGGLVVSGPTGTNVMDLVLLYRDPFHRDPQARAAPASGSDRPC